MTRLVVPELADYCFADLIQADGQIRRVAWTHVDPDEQRVFDERLAQYLPVRLHPEHPISRTLETGEPQFVPDVTSSWLERIAFSPEHLEFMRGRNFRSQMTIPLRARDRTLGALTFCFTGVSGRRFAPENLAFARELAERVALAVDNARLYTEARDAEAKVRRLLDAGVVGVIVTDVDRILEANDHFLEMVGYTREELDRRPAALARDDAARVCRAGRPRDRRDGGTRRLHSIRKGVHPSRWLPHPDPDRRRLHAEAKRRLVRARSPSAPR